MATKLYVGNLNYKTTEDALRSAFEAAGNVVSVKIIQGKGFGFVEMDSDASADKAKETLNNANLDGRSIKVNEALPQTNKREGGFGGGGGYKGGGGGYKDGGERRPRY